MMALRLFVSAGVPKDVPFSLRGPTRRDWKMSAKVRSVMLSMA